MNVLRRSARVRYERLRRSSARLLAIVVGLVVALPVIAAAAAAPAAAAPDDTLRVLLFYKDNFHASHVQARQAVRDLAAELGTQYSQTVEIEETQDPAVFNTANLATKDTVVFAQTGGVLFNTDQRAALEAYIRGGGGFMGLHYTGWSVGQSEHDVNPFYLKLVGAMSEGHPENPGVRSGRVVVKATGHPLTQGLGTEITRNDEWYDWTLNPAPNVRILVEADESSYQSLGRQGSSHPITWCQQIDSGRSWYTGMGHEGTAYSEPFMRTQMRRGLAYAAGLLPADCSPPAKDEAGGWSGVTPWPLMPINMALTSDGKVQSFGSVGGWGNDTTPFDWTGDSSITQGGQMEFDVWDPAQQRTLANYKNGLMANNTYTDLFCSMQVQNPHTKATMTVGGDDGLGGNAPNDAAIGVTSYKTNTGLKNAAPMNYPRWYPTGTTTSEGDIVVQGGSLRGGPGGPGVLTPEIYRPDEGSSWKLLTGAKSALAYGDGGNGNGPDENRWWYPRAFVAPGSGNIFNISGTQMFELDPSGEGQIINRGTLPAGVSNQGADGNPVGATSTAAMYRPGKILQVGGGWWANGGGPAGARGGFTVDVTGGTESPVVTKTAPMEYQRHWPTATVLPDGDVIVTGGSRDNNGEGGYVTEAEIWNPDTGVWKTVEVPYEHARLYHSTALLLPDGRLMIGGGGAPGPRNYTDVEYYSPSYLYDGNELAERPVITTAPKKVGYDGSFQIGASGPVSRVTLVRNGSVTHGFNNDQNFQDLEFSQAGGTVTIDTPEDGTYAPPGAYMLFVFDEDGTPSVAKIVDIDPTVEMDQLKPEVVDQFEYPRLPTEWRGANPPNTIDLAPGNGRMAPWAVQSQVQLVRGTVATQGGLGGTGYQLALGQSGSIERRLQGLDPGREYRVSLRYARDSRSVGGTGAANAQLKVGSLDATITATTDNPSQGTNDTTYGTYAATFTADQRTETLSLTGDGTGAGLMVDDLVVVGSDPGLSDVPIHYEFEEGTGTSVANTGTDDTVGAATLTGTTGWSDNGTFGKALDMPGGNNANAVDLPDNLLKDETDFTTSFWVRPDTKGNWINLFHIGDGLGDAGSFFQIQMQTQAQGNTGLAATFKKKGNPLQERVYATPTKDVTANQWNHVVFTREGTTGRLYLNGVEIASKNNFTLTMADVGATTNNWLGRNGYPDPSYDGLMDEVRLYKTALSADAVDALYDEGSSLRTTTTVAVSPASPSPFAEPLSVSTTVEGSNSAPAQGEVELWVDGARVGTAVSLVSGAATFPEVTINRGDHDIEVRYLAAEGWRNSTKSVTHTVQRPPVAEGTPVHYAFDEGSGGSSANSGTDASIGSATLNPAWWGANGKFGAGVNLPGGGSGTGNHVVLPNNIEQDLEDEFSVSIWANPRALPNWVPLLQIGSSTDTFFLLQSSTQAAGATGFAATFKAPGNANQERLTLGAGNDLPLNAWTHVVFTMSGGTGRIYFDGELVGTRDNFTLGIDDIGVGGNTTANMIGGTSWPDPRFNGWIDDFRMYGHELSAEEVGELFEGPPPSSVPVALGNRYNAEQDTALEVAAPGVLGNDTDADTDAEDLTAVGATQPDNGDVALDADGSFTYTPDAGFTGVDTFTYRASDGENESAPATVTVVVAPPPAADVPPIHYTLDEGAGSAAGNTGYDTSFGDGELLGSTVWSDDAKFGKAVNLPGGASTTNNHIKLPDNLDRDLEDEFSVSIWANPRALPNYVPLLQIGSSTDSFFLLQSSTQAGPGNSASGFAATFKEAGNANQERLMLGAGNDLPLNSWTHVVFTMSGTTGRIYFDGELMATRENFTLGIDDIGVGGNTTANMIGGTSWPDQRFNGLVDDFRMYGHELSADEVTDLFENFPNTAPTGAADAYTTSEGDPLTVAAPGVLANDTDADEDTLTATGITQPGHGTATLADNGSFTYVPASGFHGTDTFTYLADDGTDSSDPVTVTITVREDDTPAPPTVVDTSLTGTAGAFTYGRSGSLTATISPATATGRVEVLYGSTVIATGTLSGGKATAALPAKSLPPGTPTLTVRYVGDPTHRASTATVRVVVKEVTPTIRVQAPKKIKAGARANVKIRVAAPAGVPVTGKVAVAIKGGKTIVGTVKKGAVVVRLPAARKAGKLNLKVTYLGSDLAAKVVKSATITVVRKR
ncbi:LamG-like jellyroll fold domain-containing protein [Nocardioides endophyticus]